MAASRRKNCGWTIAGIGPPLSDHQVDSPVNKQRLFGSESTAVTATEGRSRFPVLARGTADNINAVLDSKASTRGTVVQGNFE
jgi:hypothetical protein